MKKFFAIVLLLFLVAALCYFYFLNPENNNNTFATCILKYTTGYDCPGCGGQRALHHILHGNLVQAFKLNPFIYILFPVISYYLVRNILIPFNVILPPIKLSNRTILLVLILLLLFAILRNLPFYPFSVFKS